MKIESKALKIESLERFIISLPNFLVALRARARAIIAGIINWSRSLLNQNAAGSGAKNNTLERFLALLDACSTFCSLKVALHDSLDCSLLYSFFLLISFHQRCLVTRDTLFFTLKRLSTIKITRKEEGRVSSF